MSIIELSAEDRRNLAAWIGIKSCKLSLLYSAERDGCSGAAFHAKCDNRCPLLVVASNCEGYIFGGYAPMPWVSPQNVHLSAPNAFLFRLRNAQTAAYMKFAAIDEKTVIGSAGNLGPWFGTDAGKAALSFFTKPYQKNPGENWFTCDTIIDLTAGFQNNGEDNNALHGGDNKLINIEVYAVEDDNLYDPEQEWRRGLVFSESALMEFKEDILKFHPPKKLFVPKANILLAGQVGSGKSSFYNTLNSTLQGHVTVKATSGSAGHSVTSKFRQYELRPERGERALKLRLCDTMGLEDQNGLNIKDVPYVLDGNLRNGFQFNPNSAVTPKHPEYNATPKDKDCIHVVALVVDATTVTSMSATLHDQLKQIISMANDRGLPVAVILSKVDDICSDVSKDVSMVFRSMAVKGCVDILAEKLGILQNAVLPVKNYNRELTLDLSIDVFALHTLRHLTRMADDYFDDQMEQKGLYEDEEEN